MKRATFHSLWLICLLLGGCFWGDPITGDAGQQQAATSHEIFDDGVTQLTVQVYYEPNAEPYTGAAGPHDTWDLTRDSLEALFQTHAGRAIVTPQSAADLQRFDTQSQLHWTYLTLQELAARLNHRFQSGTQIYLPVVFVNGYYEGSSEVLGQHIPGTPFAFIFKDAIKAVGGTAVEQRYIEQAVVLHELGHLMGLVNFGVPMVSDHEDEAHPGHTTDAACVMDWKTENASDVLAQVTPYVNASQTVLFGAHTLQDGRAFHP